MSARLNPEWSAQQSEYQRHLQRLSDQELLECLAETARRMADHQTILHNAQKMELDEVMRRYPGPLAARP